MSIQGHFLVWVEINRCGSFKVYIDENESIAQLGAKIEELAKDICLWHRDTNMVRMVKASTGEILDENQGISSLLKRGDKILWQQYICRRVYLD
jgi:hypothetical protein